MIEQPKTLIILRGLPGSGKTTVAQFITPNYVEADMFFMKTIDGESVYDFQPEKLRAAHQWCYDQVKGMLEMGESKVAVSNTATREWEFEKYIELAKEYNYRFFVLTTENYHGGTDTHDLPEDTLETMESRYTLRLRNKTVVVNK